MARGRTATVMVEHHEAASRAVRPDHLVVEEPLDIRLDDRTVTVTMRTPGHDYELAAGFCFTEGLLDNAPVRAVRYCATGPASETYFNVVTVSTGGVAPAAPPRLHASTSSCGICGTASVEQLQARLSPLRGPPITADGAVLARVDDGVRQGQELFETTGAIHAAASFDPATGAVAVVREDIGRHNAVDKVVGHHLLDPTSPRPDGLWVSGRASFEIVQKAWAAGFGLVVAVSAPSALAVQTARVAGITLIGFLRRRGGSPVTYSFNSYSPPP